MKNKARWRYTVHNKSSVPGNKNINSNMQAFIQGITAFTLVPNSVIQPIYSLNITIRATISYSENYIITTP
jgi:hypothetical protein